MAQASNASAPEPDQPQIQPQAKQSQASPGPPPQEKKPPSAGKDGASSSASANSTPASTSKDRLFFALPNFGTLENGGKVVPLTAGEKFKLAARSSFDPVQIPWYAALAGISQAEDGEEGYGQGAAGYGKRFGAYAADGTIENLMVGAVMPSIFREDPRYFQSGHGGFAHRAGYAMTRIVVTRTDSGHSQFNFSEVLGSALSSGISTYSYHPREDRKLGNAASVWGGQLGLDAMTLVIKEFWPDIRRKMKKQPH
jgi:hypothetical protein